MASFNDILTRIDEAIERFNKKIPASQRAMLDGLEEQLKNLDLRDGKIRPTIKNLRIVRDIKSKLLGIVLNDDYLGEVKKFADAFNDVTTLQHEYWSAIESKFKPTSILKEVRTTAISDTVSKLTEAGIGPTIGENISDILRTNITTGGSYKDLTAQLRDSLTNNGKSDGVLAKYAKQITTDSIHQYNANYTQIISSDLGYEFYAYQGTEIKTSREFCQSMVEHKRYFHISEIPRLLRAEDMVYTDNNTGKEKEVRINPGTDLPYGFIAGTNAENFFIRRGGYQCGHLIRPVSANLVKIQDPQFYNSIINSPEYKAWKAINS
jgi:hypothetical protein